MCDEKLLTNAHIQGRFDELSPFRAQVAQAYSCFKQVNCQQNIWWSECNPKQVVVVVLREDWLQLTFEVSDGEVKQHNSITIQSLSLGFCRMLS